VVDSVLSDAGTWKERHIRRRARNDALHEGIKLEKVQIKAIHAHIRHCRRSNPVYNQSYIVHAES
jgi:hypothetical protein